MGGRKTADQANDTVHVRGGWFMDKSAVPTELKQDNKRAGQETRVVNIAYPRHSSGS